MIEREQFAPYFKQALNIARQLSFVANGREDLATDLQQMARDHDINIVHASDKKFIRLAPGLKECPVTGKIASTTVHIAKNNVPKNYAILPFLIWHLYVQDHEQPDTMKLSGHKSPLTTRMMKTLGLSYSDVVQSAMLGQTLTHNDHFIQFSQRMDEIIVVNYVHKALTMTHEANYNVTVALSEAAIDGMADMRGRPVQSLIDAPFMEKSSGKIIHAAGTPTTVSVRVEEDPVLADLWLEKKTTKHAIAGKIWAHIEATQAQIA